MTIRLIILDMDGTLIDLKNLHFEALNMALPPKYRISIDDHDNIYEGLLTKEKVRILAASYGLPRKYIPGILKLKQHYTLELFKKLPINKKILPALKKFRADNFLIYVASDAVGETVKEGLEKLRITDLIDKVYSREGSKNLKPHPEIFLKCMVDAGVGPSETLIIEDSKRGLESAVRSGAFVYAVDNSFDFKYENIAHFIKTCKSDPVKWPGKSNLNILIPMAGAGSRFSQVGYTLPKPLIPVKSIPMIERVVKSLNIDANYIFMAQKEYCEKYNLKSYLNSIAPGCKVVEINGLTEGAACTTLAAKELINNNKHLLIVNSDQLIVWDSMDFVYRMISRDIDGGIATFKATASNLSYAQINELNRVTKVAEKQVISDNATAGAYYWKKGSDYIKFAEQMIAKNIRINNEFYVCPVYNEALLENKKFLAYNVKKVWGLGTPEDLNYFLENYNE